MQKIFVGLRSNTLNLNYECSTGYFNFETHMLPQNDDLLCHTVDQKKMSG